MSRAVVRKSAHISLADMRPRAEEAAAMLSALANPKRLLVLCSLVEEKERSVGDLAALVGLSDAALSQHLSKMRTLNLVRSRREGQTIYYSLASQDVRAVLETLHRRFCATD